MDGKKRAVQLACNTRRLRKTARLDLSATLIRYITFIASHQGREQFKGMCTPGNKQAHMLSHVE